MSGVYLQFEDWWLSGQFFYFVYVVAEEIVYTLQYCYCYRIFFMQIENTEIIVE